MNNIAQHGQNRAAQLRQRPNPVSIFRQTRRKPIEKFPLLKGRFCSFQDSQI